MRSQLFALSRKEHARRRLGVLRAFAKAFKVSVGDIEFSVEPELGTADSGSLGEDLPGLLTVIAQAAKESGVGIALLIDEVQYLSTPEGLS